MSSYRLSKIPIAQQYLRYFERDNLITATIRDEILTDSHILKARKLLHMNSRGRELCLHGRMEINALLSLAMYEIKINEKTPLDLYQARLPSRDPLTLAILNARQNCNASLFEITRIKGICIYLSDLLSFPHVLQSPLVDIALSKTAQPNLVLFLDIMPLPNFFIRAGAAFAFSSLEVQELQHDFARYKGKINSNDCANPGHVGRVAFFFQRNRKIGMPISEKPVPSVKSLKQK